MRVLSIVHQDDAGAGVFAAAADELVVWKPSGGSPPPALEGFDAAMVLGGAMNVDEEHLYPWMRQEKELLRGLVESGLPVLGVCLGAQLVAEAADARPRHAAEPEIGWRRVELTPEGAADPVVGPLAPSFEVFQWHSYEAPLPPRAVALASSSICLQAFRLEHRPVWGLQFHAEVTAADLGHWLDNWEQDPDAARSGQDPEAIRAEAGRRIGAQNELGRALAARFVAEARERT